MAGKMKPSGKDDFRKKLSIQFDVVFDFTITRHRMLSESRKYDHSTRITDYTELYPQIFSKKIALQLCFHFVTINVYNNFIR